MYPPYPPSSRPPEHPHIKMEWKCTIKHETIKMLIIVASLLLGQIEDSVKGFELV